MPRVTIGLPVYNGGAALQLAVRSIVRQTFAEWELVVLDDGSTDGAVKIVEAMGDPRIIVVTDGKSRGLAWRLNQAIEMARGEYFARMDHDDIAHPDRLAEEVAFLDLNSQVDLLATNCITINEKGLIVGVRAAPEKHREICARPWLGFPMPHPTWMGRLSWFKKTRYRVPAPYCAEDYEFLLRCYQGSQFAVLPQKLLAYRVRERVRWRKMWMTHKAITEVQISHFLRRGAWFQLLLAFSVTFARVARDWLLKAMEVVGIRRRRGSLRISSAELEEWTIILEGLRCGPGEHGSKC